MNKQLIKEKEKNINQENEHNKISEALMKEISNLSERLEDIDNDIKNSEN